jgi:hypothetical protein
MSPACEHYSGCKDRLDRLESRVDAHDVRLQTHGETIAVIRAQVTIWAAVGALAGGGIVSVMVNMFSK